MSSKFMAIDKHMGHTNITMKIVIIIITTVMPANKQLVCQLTHTSIDNGDDDTST